MSTDEQKLNRLRRFERVVEVPMLVLAVLLIPIIVMPAVEDLSDQSARFLWWLGTAIWIAFVVEYLALLYLSPHRWQTVKEHKLDLALVVLPFLRPLRVARILRLAHLGTATARAIRAIRSVLGRPGFDTMLLTVTGFIFVGGTFVSLAEHEQPGSTIAGLFDGIWWAFVTCTTVGYGDEFPVTTSGRAIAVILMLVGISGLSVVTANIAAHFIVSETEDETMRLESRLASIEEKLDLLRTHLHKASEDR